MAAHMVAYMAGVHGCIWLHVLLYMAADMAVYGCMYGCIWLHRWLYMAAHMAACMAMYVAVNRSVYGCR